MSFLNPRLGGGLRSRRTWCCHLPAEEQIHPISVEVLWKESRRWFY